MTEKTALIQKMLEDGRITDEEYDILTLDEIEPPLTKDGIYIDIKGENVSVG